MKQVSRIFLLLSITALMVGCKLAVIVVEGGEVQSIGSGTCVTGSICIVDVTDPNFAETFMAVPDTGWYFQKWNSGDRFFCGGSPNPLCILSFKGAKKNPLIEELVSSSELFYLMPIFKQTRPEMITVNGRAVIVDGREWLQPVDFVNYSYIQVSQTCPGGVCSGTLPESKIDLTGYIWASSDDVQSLFNVYQGMDRAMLGDFEDTLTEKDNDTGQVVNHTLYALLSKPSPIQDALYTIATVYVGLPFETSKEERSIYPAPIYESGNKHTVGAWFWRPL
jgi:hypothetical protein